MREKILDPSSGSKTAVLPALGIGDALLMMIASHQLKLAGYRVTTFHDGLPELAPWLPGHDLQKCPSIDALQHFDLIVVENDNSPKIKILLEAFRPKVSILYPSYSATKHSSLFVQDYVFDGNVPMADNIAKSIASFLRLASPSKENGLTPPHRLTYRLNKKRVIIHPMSRMPAKNWKVEGFLEVAEQLKKKNYEPVFCVGPAEREAWNKVSLAHTPTLADLASLVYESGYVIGNDSLIGHLASNLNIPTLVIANDEKRMRLWRPGWHKGQLVLPPPYLPNWKFVRLREKKWQHFISPRKILRSFDELVRSL